MAAANTESSDNENISVTRHSAQQQLFEACNSGKLKQVVTLLQESTVDLTARDSAGDTALHIATQGGHTAIVKQLCANIKSPRADRNAKGQTPIHVAATKGQYDIVEILCTTFLQDSEAKDRSGDTALHYAALWGRGSIIDLLCRNFNCNPHALGRIERTPLHHACSGGHIDTVRKLVTEYGASVKDVDHDGNAPIHCAAFYGHSEVVFALIGEFQCPATFKGAGGNTLFHNACAGGHVVLAKEIVQKFGVDPHEKGAGGSTSALHFTATNHVALSNVVLSDLGSFHNPSDCDGMEMIKVLVTEFGISPNVPNTLTGETPLHAACFSGHVKAMKLLILQFKCNPLSTVDKAGLTPLHVAARSGRKEVVVELVSTFKCNVNCVDYSGASPLQLCCRNGHIDVAEKLVSYGADLAHTDTNGNSIMHYAAVSKNAELVKNLRYNHNCVALSKNKKDETPLHLACQKGCKAVVKVFVSEFKCDPTQPDSAGNTSLHHAVVDGHEDVVSMLIKEYKCPVDCVNRRSQTPLHLACDAGHINVVQVLLNDFQACTSCKDANGNTARDIATRKGYVVIVEMFESSVHVAATPSVEVVHKQQPSSRSEDSREPSQAELQVQDTTLLDACKTGDLAQVQALLQEPNCNLQFKDPDGNTALHLSAQFNYLHIARTLIAKFTDPGVNSLGQTPLHVACMHGSTEVAELLAVRLPNTLRVEDLANYTPLLMAALFGHTDVVDLLLVKFHCSPNIPNSASWNALGCACAGGCTDIVVKLITKYHSNPFHPGSGIVIPFNVAAFFGRTELVNKLIQEFGCSVDDKDGDGNNLLHLACIGGHASTVRLLVVDYGCDIFEPDSEGNMALHFATMCKTALTQKYVVGYADMVYLETNRNFADLIRLLVVELKCPVDVKNCDGLTPLHIASIEGNLELVKLFLTELDCDPYCHDTNGSMPIHYAARGGHSELLSYLVKEQKVAVDSVNFQLTTPLHLASEAGQLHLCKTLLSDFNANPGLKDGNGMFPVELALLKGHTDIVKLLSESRHGSSGSLVDNSTLPSAIDVRTQQDPTLVRMACKLGDLNQVQNFLSQAESDHLLPDEVGNTLLHIASENDHLPIVKELLGHCSTTQQESFRNNDGRTPLHLASASGHVSVVQHLALFHLPEQSQPYFSIFAKDNAETTPIHLAALNGKKEVVNLLISEFKCSPDSIGALRQSLLHAACDGGHIDLVSELILKHGADLDSLDSNGATPLHIACLAGRKQVARELLTTFNYSVDTKDSAECTPLHNAAANGHASTVEMLVSDFKADTQSRNSMNNTPLNTAAVSGHTDVVDLLITKFGCSPAVKGFRGKSLVHQACDCDKPELVKTLVNKHGCDIAAKDDGGNTPIHQACGTGNVRTVQLLIELGSPLDIKNNTGDTPLHTAAMAGNTQLMRQLILQHGCSIDWRTNGGQSLLHSACQKGQLETAEVLLSEFKADPLAQDFDGNTALHHAAYGGHIPVAKLLITEYKCPVDVVNFYLNTPLHCACVKGESEVVEVLVREFKADVSLKNNKGQTALAVAKKGDQNAIVAFLSQFPTPEDETPPTSVAEDTNQPVSSSDLLQQYDTMPLHRACRFGDLKQVQRLAQEHSSEFVVCDEEGNSPLHVAAQYGHVSIVKELLEKHSSSHQNLKNHSGRTPLHVAAYNGQTEVVQFLATKVSTNPEFTSLFGLDITDNKNDTALNLAAVKGQIDVVKLLLSQFHCSPHVKGFDGLTILHQACSSGNVELVTLLISKYNMHTDTADVQGLMPLHLACLSGKTRVVEELVHKFKCPVDSIELSGETPMHKAARQGHTDIIKVIHKAGASLVTKNWEGDTPLNTAALVGQLDSVQVFISELGCDPNVRGFNNRTPLLQACDGGHVDIVRLLISVFNCDVTAKDDNGNTPVLIASVSGKLDVLEVLINEFKCDLNVVTHSGTGPLHVACQHGHTEVVERLISQYKCDPSAADGNGITPLHHAIVSGNVSLVRKLIKDHHCNPNVKTTKLGGHSPLHDACQKGKTAIAQTLISEFSCDPMDGDAGGNTAVHHAVFGGQLDTLRMLTSEFKVDVNCVNFQLSTPLHLACERGHVEVARVLIEELMADSTHQDLVGRTPLQIATTSGHSNIVRLFHRATTEHENEEDTPQASAVTGSQTTLPRTTPTPETRRVNKEHTECTAVGGTLLHEACKTGDAERVQSCIQDPAHANDVTKVDSDGNTPLHIASFHGNIGTVKVLLSKTYETTSRTNAKKETALHLACKRKHNGTIIELLASNCRSDLTKRDCQGDLPIHVACLYGRKEAVQVLCEVFKCNPNTTGCNGRTCLHHACSGGHVYLVRKLVVKYKCNPEARDSRGSSPLHCAAFFGHSDVFFLLINELNCPIHILGREHSTVLHYACAGGHLDLVKTLVTLYDFSCVEPNETGANALHIAAERAFDPSVSNSTTEDPLAARGCFHFSGDLSHIGVIRALVKDFNCPLDSQTLDGDTPVKLAMKNGYKAVIDLLVNEFNCPKPTKPSTAQSSLREADGRTLLHVAAAMNNVSLIEDLITRQDFDIYARDYQGATPLHSAALNGGTEAAQVLVTTFGCPVDIPSNSGHTPLHCAAQNGHLRLIRILVEELHCNILSQDNTGSLPVHQAAVAGQADAVRLLVKEFKCPVDSVNFALQTPLHVSCVQGPGNVVNVLVNELGANPAQVDVMGNTPLDIALKLGNAHLSKVLTESGGVSGTSISSQGAPQPHTRDALFQACRRGDVVGVERLIQERGHNPREPDDEGCTPLHVASRSGHISVVEKLAGTFDCDPFALNKDGDTPLHLAVASRKEAVVDLLISKFHCDPTYPGGKGRSPIHIACYNGDIDMVLKFVQVYGVDIMATDHDQNTPLHLAALYGRSEVVRTLSVDFSCDPNAKNKDSKTALDLSTEKQHQECIEWLSQYPAQDVGESMDQKMLAKVLLVGENLVGKSSVVETLTRSSHTVSTCSRMNLVSVKALGVDTVFLELLSDSLSTAYALRQLLKSPGCIVLLVVDIKKATESIVEDLNLWLSLISCVASEEAMAQPKVLVAASHDDILEAAQLNGTQKLTDCVTQVQTMLQDHLQFINIVGYYSINCCSFRSQNTQHLKLALLQSLHSLRQEPNPRFTTSHAFNLLQILRSSFPSGTSIPTMSDITQAASSSQHLDQLQQVQAALQELQQSALVHCVAEWVVPCTTILNILKALSATCCTLSQEPSTLPLSFHSLCDFGIRSVEEVVRVLQGIAPAPLIQCLEDLHFSQRIQNVDHVLAAVIRGRRLNQQVQVVTSSSVLFCPALTRATKQDNLWKVDRYVPFTRGFLVKPVNEHTPFPSHFVKDLILDIAFTCVFPSLRASSQECQCELTGSSIHWVTFNGVEALVMFLTREEMTRSGIMIAVRGTEHECNQLMSLILATVENVKQRMCRTLTVECSYIHPSDLYNNQIPSPSKLHLFSETVLREALQLMEGIRIEGSAVDLYNRLTHLTFWNVLFPIHAREIELYLEPVADRWRDIGKELRLPEHVLQRLHGSLSPAEALHGMVKEWLESGHYLSKAHCWATLVDALSKLQLDDIVTRVSLNRESEITLQRHLLDTNHFNARVDDVFLETLADFTRSMWPFLAAVLAFNVRDCGENGLQRSENPGLLALQWWKERDLPTFGQMLSMFITPTLHPSFYQHTCGESITPVRPCQPPPNPNVHSPSNKYPGTKAIVIHPHTLPGNLSCAIWDVHLSSSVHSASIESKGKQVQFKDIGIAFTFPRGVVPKDSKVKLAVVRKLELPRSYTLRPGLHLCSPVYFITTQPNNVKLLKPISLAVKLSSRLATQEQCKSLAFVKSGSLEGQLDVVSGNDAVVEFKLGSTLGKATLDLLPQMILAIVQMRHS